MSFQLQETLNRIAALKEANAAAIQENKEKNTNHKVVEEKTFDLMEKMTRNIRTHNSCTKAVFILTKYLAGIALEVPV